MDFLKALERREITSAEAQYQKSSILEVEHLMRDALSSTAMRTTLDIDDDILQAARERARRERRTMGEVISALARRGLSSPSTAIGVAEPPSSYGFRPLPKRGGLVTNEIIDRLREDDAY